MATLSTLLCVVAAPAQVTFRSDVSLVTIAVRVTNLGGHEVNGLAAGDFTLLEDGRPRKIAFFAAENEPMSLFVLLDASTSMRSSAKYTSAKSALQGLLNAAPLESQLFFGEFSDKLESLTESTAGSRQNTSSTVPPESGGTALYDAISFALCTLRFARYPRQVLVVVTDGADEDSRLRLSELTEIVRSAQAQVFVLGYFNEREEQDYRARKETIVRSDESVIDNPIHLDNPIHVFQSLARLSGADVAYPASEQSLARAVERIRNTLETQYSLSYYLQPDAKSYRRIEVKVKRLGMKVRARPGLGVLRPERVTAVSNSGCLVTAKNHPYPYETRVSIGSRGLRVYRDDFRDPASGWPNRDFFHYGPDGYHILKSASYGKTVISYGPWWGNFRASVTVSFMEETPPGAAAGLAFSINDTRHSALGNNRGLYSLLIANSGRKIILLNEERPNSRELFSAEVAARGPHRIGAECVAGEIRVLLNGNTIGVVQDRTRTGGMVGLQVTGAGHAVFRELVVEELGASR